jgi:hypothetical protein
MVRRSEHFPGESALMSGTYEQLNIFGSATGIRASVRQGQPMPVAPNGHSWMLTGGDADVLDGEKP